MLCIDVRIKQSKRNLLPKFYVQPLCTLRSGFLVRPWFLKIFVFLMHDRVLMQPRLVSVALLVFASIVACEIIAFQISPFYQ